MQPLTMALIPLDFLPGYFLGRHSGMVRKHQTSGAQYCAPGNLEIPGSRFQRAPE
jgi:hypothetical protein